MFITEPGSYKLTGNLDLTATPDTTAIQIAAPFVTLDLNGFEIVGPKVCTGSGPTLDCGGVEDGAGVLIEVDGRAAVVRNGTVRNMGGEGVWGFSDGLTIENVRAMHNGRDGLRGESDSIVTNSISIENRDDGFDFDSGSILQGNAASGNGDDGIEIDGPGAAVDNSSARGNGNRGFNLASSSRFGSNVSLENASADTCGGGICSERRRFYLSDSVHLGNEALTACSAGFHMAAMNEIWDLSDWQYDSVLGYSTPDMGSGPPWQSGWIRTGLHENVNYNCSGWQSNLDLHQGALVNPDPPSQWDTPPWARSTENCDQLRQVWCAED